MNSKQSPLAKMLSTQAKKLRLDSGDVRRLLAERGVYISPQAVRYWHAGQTAPADAIRPTVADVYGVTFLDLSRAAAGLISSACAPEERHSPGKVGGAGFPFNASMYVRNGAVDLDRLSIDLASLTGEQALDVLAEIVTHTKPASPVTTDPDQLPLFHME